MLAAIPGVITMGASAAKTAQSLFAKKGTPDNFKNTVWSKVPFALRRITGGSGKWRDTVTGEKGNDQWGDVRAVAVVAPAVNGYVDSNGVLYDNDTGAALSHEDAWARWTSRYGTASFASAYQGDPTAFHPYTNVPSDDPTIGKAAPKPSGGVFGPAKDYVEGQVQSVIDTAQTAAHNIGGVAGGAVAGAYSGASAGANTAAATQGITQSSLMWVGLGLVALVVVIVVSKKRG